MPRTDRIRRIATWLALAGSIGLALVFVAMRATTPSDGARISFYGDGWTDLGVLIAPIDPPADGLESGDVVVTVGDQSMEAWLGVSTDPSRPRPAADGPILYGVIRGGAPQAVDVTWSVPALGATLLAGWSVVLFSVSTILIAAFVFARRPDEPAATALMIAACAAGGSSVPWFLGTTVSDVVEGTPFVFYALITGPLYMLLWPAGLPLAMVFPTPSPIVARHRWVVPGLYVVGMGAV